MIGRKFIMDGKETVYDTEKERKVAM